MDFTHEGSSQRVRFATAAATDAVSEEADLLGVRRTIVIASARHKKLARALTAGVKVAAFHHGVREHVPQEAADAARDVANEHDADAVICVGGGSATGLAKVVALTRGVPIVAVPTTYAGSEATNVWGLTTDGTKTTGADPRALPQVVVYDASLTIDLPVKLSVASGLNALVHAVDSMWAPHANQINAAIAGEAVRVLAASLPQLPTTPRNMFWREQMLVGTYLASSAFSAAGSGLHHKICHVLGGRYNLSHAATHASVLPHVVALNAPHARDAERRLARSLDASSALTGLVHLYRRLGAPPTLRQLGLREDQIPAAAAEVVRVAPQTNPAAVDIRAAERVLYNAWSGAGLSYM